MSEEKVADCCRGTRGLTLGFEHPTDLLPQAVGLQSPTSLWLALRFA